MRRGEVVAISDCLVDDVLVVLPGIHFVILQQRKTKTFQHTMESEKLMLSRINYMYMHI